MEKDKIVLSENYRLVIPSSLSFVEEMLLEIDNLTNSEFKGIFTYKKNTLDDKNQHLIHKKIENMLDNLKNIKTALNFNLEVINNKRLISSRCGKTWEILCDLETKRLREYGKPLARLSEYFNCKI